jgi:hypothetical protein
MKIFKLPCCFGAQYPRALEWGLANKIEGEKNQICHAQNTGHLNKIKAALPYFPTITRVGIGC